MTGANGYIGKHVVKELLDTGCDVIACDLESDNIDNRATIRCASIFKENIDAYKEFGEPEVLIHLAWESGFEHNSKNHMELLSSHVKFLTSMMEGGVKSISVMGSMHEVGYWEGKIDESTPCNPLNNYGISKNALREWILLNSKKTNIKVKWLRAFYIYGDNENGCSIFSKITKAVNDGKKYFPFTLGKNRYDFISIDDLSKQIVAASLQNNYDGIINVCSGTAKTLREQVEWFIKENNYDIKLEYGAFPNRAYDSPCIYGDPQIINKIMETKDIFNE